MQRDTFYEVSILGGIVWQIVLQSLEQHVSHICHYLFLTIFCLFVR